MRNARHVLELDGVRGIAILSVMLMHFVSEVAPWNAVERALVRASVYGVWGVDLFFVLSGFLITGILFDAKSDARYFQNFYARRTLRIFPLYYALLLVLFVLIPEPVAGRLDPALLEARKAQFWVWPYLTNVYLARAGSFAIPYVSHFWSLAVEEHFYLVWPFIVRLLDRRPLMTLCVLVSLASAGLRVWLSWRGVNDIAIFVLTPCRLDTLCAGAWFALAARGPEAQQLLRRCPLAIALTTIVVVVSSAWHAAIGSADAVVLPLRGLALALLFALVIFSASSDDGPAFLKRALRAGWLRWLGKYSYGLYVFHGLLAYGLHIHEGVTEALTQRLGSHGLAMAVQVAASMALSVFVAVLSYELFESRLLKLKKWFDYRARAA